MIRSIYETDPLECPLCEHPMRVNPEVRVHLAVDSLPAAADSGAEEVQILGVPQAFFDRQKVLVLSFGPDAAGRNIRVRLEGDRERVLTIAHLFTESSLRTLATKQISAHRSGPESFRERPDRPCEGSIFPSCVTGAVSLVGIAPSLSIWVYPQYSENSGGG